MLRLADDGLGQRVFGRLLDRGGDAQHLVLGEALGRHDGGDGGTALGERAGLVDDERVDLLKPLQRRGIADQHAGRRAPADADHDRHGRGEAEGAGAGDDQHRDRCDKGKGELRRRAEDRPGGEGADRDRQHDRHEPAGDLIGEALDRRPRPLGGGDELDDLRQHRVAADLVG